MYMVFGMIEESLQGLICYRQILTHIRCHMDDARIAVETGVDGV